MSSRVTTTMWSKDRKKGFHQPLSPTPLSQGGGGGVGI